MARTLIVKLNKQNQDEVMKVLKSYYSLPPKSRYDALEKTKQDLRNLNYYQLPHCDRDKLVQESKSNLN